MAAKTTFNNDPLWYKDAIIYELHVKAFYDGVSDGIGDFKGLTEKLEYLQWLGITAVWLLPFFPSPLKDDGYDISDYFDVHPNYGTMKDFKIFLHEAHKRDISVIIELIMNHTSDKHTWFQEARREPAGTSKRNFYVWSDNPDKYKDARIIFKDFEASNWAWDPVARSYYWHRFYSHQPDLNFDSPDVQRAMFKVVEFWLDMGVDGLRLDAVPYLFEREGTNCENLKETHDFLKKLRKHIDKKYTGKMLLAEANQWPEDSAAYFGNGNSCHMAFHFPLMPRMFMAIQMEDRFPLIDIMEQTPAIHDSCQWVIFLRNHDELTLEMVTDEERDYMYKVYARDSEMRINLGIRRRLAPLMGNNRRKIELMNILLMSFPGTPVIYYGDELGMGDNYYLGDRDGVRTPMQWSAQRNAGFSVVNPQKLYLPTIIDPEYHYEVINVENQQRNPSSLLWWIKQLIAVRKKLKSLCRGNIGFVSTNNSKVIAFTRHYDGETVLVVVNLSRFSQSVELDLSKYAGMLPEEVFSGNKFPIIRETPYVFTLSFHDFFWFLLKDEQVAAKKAHISKVKSINLKSNVGEALYINDKKALEKEILPLYLSTCRWFAGKSGKIQGVEITEDIVFALPGTAAHILIVNVSYYSGLPEMYMLPIAYAAAPEAEKILKDFPFTVIAHVKTQSGEGIFYDATYNIQFRLALLSFIIGRKSIKGIRGLLRGDFERRIKPRGQASGIQGRLPTHDDSEFDNIESSKVLKADQSNSALLYENKLVLKLFRKLDEGINPDIELVRFIFEKGGDCPVCHNIPTYKGCIEYRQTDSKETIFMANLQAYVQNEGDAWNYATGNIKRFFENILSSKIDISEIKALPKSMLDVAADTSDGVLREFIGVRFIEMAAQLGKTTASMHLTLSMHNNNPDFTPEPFSTLYQRSLYQSMRTLARRNFELLRKNLKLLPQAVKDEASIVLNYEKEVLKIFKQIVDMKIASTRTRCHGDYHLGQVLLRGNEFVIIDFEGEPLRTLSERRLKRSPLKDAASMVRSLHYAPYSVLFTTPIFARQDIVKLTPWADLWYFYISGIFLSSYAATVQGCDFIPGSRTGFENLLMIFLLEKAVYELGYEMSSRPEWVEVPLLGIKGLLNITRGIEDGSAHIK
ncbi:MAG: maltose alpha-D-glucosyltransferase [Candidatus Magnetominusculus sp. LBB02]|nr:maltose alpha-D-glucosyltransferase [Candidatus Magnetominusculus sp. LBB02]